ncbi:MAG: peptidoglycan-binding protein [Bacteroidetes bacterium]|nr:peptidoglycan-binding protein [Bacteroidota bacterium]
MRITKGMQGPAIKQWQFFLKARGYYRGDASGHFDSPTSDGTSAFQRQNGLRQTGELDFLTYCRATVMGLPPLLNLIGEEK